MYGNFVRSVDKDLMERLNEIAMNLYGRGFCAPIKIIIRQIDIYVTCLHFKRSENRFIVVQHIRCRIQECVVLYAGFHGKVSNDKALALAITILSLSVEKFAMISSEVNAYTAKIAKYILYIFFRNIYFMYKIYT